MPDPQPRPAPPSPAADQEKIRRALAAAAARPGAAQLSATLPQDSYHRKVHKERQEAAARLFRVWRGGNRAAGAAAPGARP
ncbi:hypothetical protein, partial [Roseomonas sp. 18066]|uniref:hypothetical protein n=1 Tax=Roseomonas sp. 18066 TaxID=2681412 RepID=UPI00190F9F83